MNNNIYYFYYYLLFIFIIYSFRGALGCQENEGMLLHGREMPEFQHTNIWGRKKYFITGVRKCKSVSGGCFWRALKQAEDSLLHFKFSCAPQLHLSLPFKTGSFINET